MTRSHDRSSGAASTGERRLARIGTLLAALLFAVYSLATPLFEASDELWHYPMVMHLATGGGLPEQRAGQTDEEAPWRQEGSQPPLYYAIAALASAPFDHSNWREIRRVNTHSDMGVPTRDGNANAILHTPAEAFPWTRAALAARVARLVSIIMSAITVYAAWLIACELFTAPGDGPRRLLTMLFVACVPMFAFISGSINNDNAAAMFAALGVWRALRVSRGDALAPREALIAGALIGLAALSKSSTLGLLGLFGLAAGRVWVRDRMMNAARVGFVRLLVWLALIVVVVVALSGWWFVRNLNLYGDLLGWNAFLDVVGRRDSPASLAQLWTEREGFVWAYWGVFGTVNVIMPPWLYGVLNGLAALSAAGVLLAALRWVRARVTAITSVRGGMQAGDARAAFDSAVPWLLCAVWVLVIFVALLRWTALTPASQGRLMFPAIGPLAALMVLGLSALHRRVLQAGALVLALVAVAVPFAVIAPAYAAPPDGWSRRLAIPVDQTFGGAVRLVEAESVAVAGRDAEVTMYVNWEMITPPPANVSMFVHLINADDVIVAQRDMHPGQGVLALAERTAPYRWSDRYTLRIPRFAAPGQRLRWAAGMYDRQSGARLVLPDGSDRAVFGALTTAAAGLPPYRYANGALLEDVQIMQTGVAPGQALRVSTFWRNAAPRQPVNISVQILDDADNKIGQKDLGLSGAEDAPLQVDIDINIDAQAKPGVYRVLLVMYETGAAGFPKVGVYDGGGQFRGESLVLTRLRVR
jgi:hypothetical protein